MKRIEKDNQEDKKPVPVPPDKKPPAPVDEPPSAEIPPSPIKDDDPEKDRLRIL